jgi:hypothetical protein
MKGATSFSASGLASLLIRPIRTVGSSEANPAGEKSRGNSNREMKSHSTSFGESNGRDLMQGRILIGKSISELYQ